MGSVDFARNVFEKVFTEDINRLRSMEDMWKIREPPQPLHFDHLSEQASELVSPSVAAQDQQTWSLAENLAVFTDR